MKERGLRLTTLAKKAGVPVATLHGWTAGRNAQNLEHLRRVADALKVSVYYLCYGKEDPNTSVGERVLREIFSGDVRVRIQKIEGR